MKKIIAIVIIAITVAVTGFNIYENIPQFEVKPGTTEKVKVQKSENDSHDDKGVLSVYITFNLISLIVFFWRYWIWHNKKTINDKIFGEKSKNTFFNDVLSFKYGEVETGLLFAWFCFVNGFVVFAILCCIIYWII